MGALSQFIVHGMHLTENLGHHKQSDVRRILEEKGLLEDPDSSGQVTHYRPAPGTPDNGRQTEIRFDGEGFVAPDGVRHSG